MSQRKLPRKALSAVTHARFEAFTLLMEVERGQSYADDLLRGPRVSALSAQDRHLCTALVMGALRWQIRLDAVVRQFLSRPNARLDPAIRIALRLGTLQLQFMDRIPAHAAISESVELAKLAGHQHASRMVNAVLRMVSGQSRPEGLSIPTSVEELAAAFAHPQWMVERWASFYGIDAVKAICASGQLQPELSIRMECLEVEAELAELGILLAPGAILTAARRVLSGDVTATDAFKSGRVRIQEEGSQLIAEVAGYGDKILDACAAPGGKTIILAERNPASAITACEISSTRLEALHARIAASRYSAQIEVQQADASLLAANAVYDLVLVDVPCSGTGTLGRNPEIRHRLQVNDLLRHHERQCAILKGALKASSKRVLYSTCSLEPEENRNVVAQVLAQSPEWRQVPVADRIQELLSEGRLSQPGAKALLGMVAADGSVTLLPGSLGPDIQTDGFFMASFEKKPGSTSPQ